MKRKYIKKSWIKIAAEPDTITVTEAVPALRQGSLWKSHATRRRCRVLWVNENIVCLTYCDGVGVKQHKVEDLKRLYFEV